MKTIIAGSRDFEDDILMQRILSSIPDISEVVCGGARGADKQGQLWAYDNNIPIKMFLADWNTYGKSAGYKRNVQMAEYADCLIAFWDGVSKGTSHMIKEAKKRKLIVHVIMYNVPNQSELNFN